MGETVLEVRDLSVTFQLHDREVQAVREMNFSLKAGETLAVVGESGSGKSQAFLSIMGLLARNGRATGSARIDGKELVGMRSSDLDAIRGKDIAMIFQDPMTSLNPYMRIADQMIEVLVRHQNASRKEALERSEAMLRSVHLPDAKRVIRAYPHELSGGQRQRVMIAMALLCEPKVLFADEPTTALDVTVQAQMLSLFEELTDKFNTALVMITHDLGVVAGLADTMMVMYAGRAVEKGTVDELFYSPRHPYTLGLLHSTPRGDNKRRRLDPIKGMPPNLTNLPSGCSFHPRCEFKTEICLQKRPALEPRTDGRISACHHDDAVKNANEKVA
ncbi:MAG TPA: oligopeptide/dipeptide ABC transporter ATP-binding protein [Pelagibacterium sp.]|uniref:ABC transporter ATP-binding protein n=1 Tax=Pelagibacterium sp. TaxID=1967288 RepID=UPI002C750935|nr:oligopeptide/dipeptide ABC transporter ATP-binding protein [Pelagibacterium sp.]HWJ87049.1 oligopeptide/dipeptide ABC transporter ATP-binding protein [Pelagibacterium sp.]